MITLSTGEIHLWYIDALPAADDQARLAANLSEGEKARAARYRFDPPRVRFQVARGMLRELLAAYTQQPPERVAFAENRHGKPLFVSDTATPIEFSVSHTDEIVAIAVASGLVVGVDVERIASDVDRESIARQCFAASEAAALERLPIEVRAAAFTRLWSCKEAFLKGLGVGLSRRMDSFEISVSASGPVRLMASQLDSSEVDRWRLETFELIPGYALALAVAGHEWRVVCRKWCFGQQEVAGGGRS